MQQGRYGAVLRRGRPAARTERRGALCPALAAGHDGDHRPLRGRTTASDAQNFPVYGTPIGKSLYLVVLGNRNPHLGKIVVMAQHAREALEEQLDVFLEANPL